MKKIVLIIVMIITLSNLSYSQWELCNNELSCCHISTIATGINNIIFAGSYDCGIIASTDNGISWTEKNTGLINKNVVNIRIFGDTIWATFTSEIQKDWDHMTFDEFFSIDNGNNWTKKYSCSWCWSFFPIDRTDFRWNRPGFSISTNKGKSWTEINKVLADTLINFIATFTGIYGDSTNLLVDTSLHNKRVTINDEYIFAGTKNRGIYRAKISDLTNVEENKNINSSFMISPNPVYDNISISFTNSDLSNQSISIYNSLGIEIKRITDFELIGKSSINLTTVDFPSGIYYCTLNSGISKITKSFVVIK